MSYTPSYEKPYPEGYKNEPIETTPITAEVMNGYDDAIENIENYLAEGEMGTVVIANPEIEGTEPNLTALQVGEDKFKILSGGGSASIDYGDEESFNNWSESAQNGEIFIRTDEQKYVFIKTSSGIVRIDDKVLISKAEYDALPESKNSDNIPYYIYDWSQSGDSNTNVYSYDEVVVGEYMGKKLYRKVVEEAFGVYGTAHQVSIGVSDYMPVNYDAYRVAPDGTIIKAYNQQSSTNYWLSVEKFSNDGIYYRSSGWNSGLFRAVVEYTKVGE